MEETIDDENFSYMDMTKFSSEIKLIDAMIHWISQYHLLSTQTTTAIQMRRKNAKREKYFCPISRLKGEKYEICKLGKMFYIPILLIIFFSAWYSPSSIRRMKTIGWKCRSCWVRKETTKFHSIIFLPHRHTFAPMRVAIFSVEDENEVPVKESATGVSRNKSDLSFNSL